MLRYPPHERLGAIIDDTLDPVPATASAAEVARMLASYNLVSLPVVDQARRLVGAVSARALAGVGTARACGRLCLVDAPDRLALSGAALHMAPLVFDVTEPDEAASVAGLAHAVVLVGGPRAEPALASAMAASLARVGPAPLVVASRPAADSRWHAKADVEVPHSRLGAQWALAGREPRGELGRAIEALADLLTG